jgi:hypothetical protein
MKTMLLKSDWNYAACSHLGALDRSFQVQSSVGRSSLFQGENVLGFQFRSQNENQRFPHKVITFLRIWLLVLAQVRIWLLVLAQVRINFLKTSKGIS